MIDKVGVGDRSGLLFVEALNNGTDNVAAGGMSEFMGLLVVAPVFEAGVTVATGQMDQCMLNNAQLFGAVATESSELLNTLG